MTIHSIANKRRFLSVATRRASGRVGLVTAGFLFLLGCETFDRTDRASRSDRLPAVATGYSVPSAPDMPLTVEQAIHRALVFNSQINVLRANVTVAEQNRRAASDFANPAFESSWEQNSADRPQNVGDVTDAGNGWRNGLRLPVPNPFLLIPRVDAKAAEVQAVQADLQAATWRLTCDVRRAFLQINYLSNDLLIAGELVRLSDDILKIMRSRAEQAGATTVDVVPAVRQCLQMQDDLDQTRQRYLLAKSDLAALLNMAAESLRIATNSGALPAHIEQDPLPSRDKVEKRALQNRGDVAALHWRVQAAQAAYREARNARAPWFTTIS